MATSEHWELELYTLLSLCPPSFLFVNTTSARSTSGGLSNVLKRLSQEPQDKAIFSARVDGIACFTSRLIYDTILNGLAQWEPSWADGCANWSAEGETRRWNDTIDGFIHGIVSVGQHLQNTRVQPLSEEKKSTGAELIRLVITIEHVERLRECVPEVIVPLTRLAELSRLDVCVIFLSETRWDDIRPAYSAAPDPYFIDIAPAQKEESMPVSSSSKHPIDAYHPELRSLWSHYVALVCDVCYSFTHDLEELQYIAVARWPGFVQPILDERLRIFRDVHGHDFDPSDEQDMLLVAEMAFELPADEVRLRLTRLFNPSITAALEELYPRLTNAKDWAIANKPEDDILAQLPTQLHPFKTRAKLPASTEPVEISTLSRMSKFILVASFLASTNPAKSDLRMFGRGLDEKKRRRRRASKPSGTKVKSGPVRIPQRLAGPMPFPLDRMLAIFGALLEENDTDKRPFRIEYSIPGEYTDMETGRVAVSALIMHLCSMKLLHRSSALDKLDGPPMFKCGISYEITLLFSRQLQIPLNDLMWDPL
ncbi:hypothetical protein BDN72DRAFT_774453 [Pluteus cervinus]|uniref:Uncharacterized protein n=1 Tax=Pluteus cervinus TaxID=181527 RepID=A0ACD3AFU5_9AGAR|nr:hypothetical protein BDN72DRAFT_774453 [Pluteus cervinus]